MALKLKNRKVTLNYIASQGKVIEEALIFQLEFLVEELINHAKNSAGYEDQTSNLKSSIGGAVVKDGKPVTFRGFQGAGEVGDQTGLEFINSLVSSAGRGYVIIIVAGMNYATYVENFHNLNVLKKSELLMNNEIPKVLNKLKRKIK